MEASVDRATLRRVLRAGLVLVTLEALVAFAVLGCGITDRLLLYPQTESIDDTHGAARVPIQTKDGEIETWRARSRLAAGREPELFVLRFYGNADRADRWVAEEAAELPFSAEVWGVNYPGFGGSSGSASLRGVAESALVAHDAMKKQAGDRPILVFGTSMGTTAALYLAAHREIAGVMLKNPPPLRQLIRGHHGWWNLWLLAVPVAWGVPATLDSLENAAKAHAPAIFVMSEQDEVVPHPYQLEIRDAYAGPKQTFLLPGARHNDAIPEATRREIEGELGLIVAQSMSARPDRR